MKERKQIKKYSIVVIIILIAIVLCGAEMTSKRKSSQSDMIIVQEENKLEYGGIEEYEVGAFETLSGIAIKYIPSDEYMQEWITDVCELNERKDTTIYFGETILVYFYKE